MLLLAAALDYATAGFRVFPLWGVTDEGHCRCPKGEACGNNSGKHPHGRLAPRGLLDATDDDEVVRRWWESEPTCNIGLATGHRVFVVDVDRKPEKDGLVALQQLEQAPGQFELVASATTGAGLHLYFAVDDDAPVGCRNGWRPGVDVKGLGGYVVAPPSLHRTGRTYAWRDGRGIETVRAAPPFLLALLAAEVPPPAADPVPAPIEASAAAPPPLAVPHHAIAPPQQHGLRPDEVAEIARALELMPANCDRTTWVERVSMPLHDMFAGSDEGFQLWHRWCASAAGQRTPNGNIAYGGERECRIVWRSFSRAHRNPRGRATFWGHAIACGYRAPAAGAGGGAPAGAQPGTNGQAGLATLAQLGLPGLSDDREPWRDPDPLRVLPECPRLDLSLAFPPDLSWVGDYVSEIARLIQVRPELPALLALGLASGSYGRVFRLRLDGTDWVEYSPLWVICAFASGGGKSPVFRPLREPFSQWDAEASNQKEVDAWNAQRDFAVAKLAHAQHQLKRQMARADEIPIRERLERDVMAARTQLSVCEEMRPRSKRVLASSLTTPALVEFLEEHQERCLVVDPEGGIFQYVLGGRTDYEKDVDPWLKAFSCEPIQQNRVGDGKHRARERSVRWPCLSMAICTQVASLGMFRDAYAQGKGFLARFIPAMFSGDLPERAIVEGRVPEQLQGRWRTRIHDLLKLPVPQKEPAEVVLGGMGGALFREWTQQWLDRARSDPDADARSPIGWGSPSGAKLRSQALRIVLLMHALSGRAQQGLEVDPEHVHAVLAGWMPFVTGATRQVLGMVRDDGDLQIAERVLAFLLRREERHCRTEVVTRHAIYENLKSASTHSATVDSVSSLNGALQQLVDAGWIQPASKIIARGPGVVPAASRYYVHPQLLEHATRQQASAAAAAV